MMKKLMVVCALFAASSIAALAQDYPRVEVFGGYSYVHSTVDLGIPGVSNPGINLNGGSGSLSYNPNQTLGLVADVGVYHDTPSIFGVSVDITQVSYLFGPKLAMRSNERFTPFVQALFGGVHARASVSGSGSSSANAFAMTVGGGVDARIARSVAFRLVQLEYMLTQFSDTHNNRQNGARISTGIVFRFGS